MSNEPWRIICADAGEAPEQFEDESIDLIVTSPPYYGLRRYGAWEQYRVWRVPEGGEPFPASPKHKRGWRGRHRLMLLQMRAQRRNGLECPRTGARIDALGLEPHPKLYLDHLLEIFDAWKPKLKPTGCCFVVIGDTYCNKSSSESFGSDPRQSARFYRPMPQPDGSWLKPKNLLLIPSRFAIGMQDRGWWVRNDIVWHKPNAMPSSVKDRFSCTWEHVFMFTKNARYYFDLDAVRAPFSEATIQRVMQPNVMNQPGGLKQDDLRGQPTSGNASRCNLMVRSLAEKIAKGSSFTRGKTGEHQLDRASENERDYSPLGKNPGDCWIITTKPFPSAHFATFPPSLIRPLIRAGCPPKACVDCGKPWLRITEEEREPRGDAFGKREPGEGLDHGQAGSSYQQVVERKTVGWQPTCSCGGATEPGLTVDPFGGAHTTGAVCIEEDRRYIGVDISEEYNEMGRLRIEKAWRQKQHKLPLE